MNLDVNRTQIVFDAARKEQGIQVTLYPRDESFVVHMTFEGFEAKSVFHLSARRAPGKGRRGSLSPEEMRRLADAYPLLVDYARAEILWEHEAVPSLHAALMRARRSREPGTRERLTDEAVARFAVDVRALERAGEPHPGKVLAERYGLSPSNISRRRKRAIELGYLN